MTKGLAALAGALVAPLAVVLGVALLYPHRGPENWDMGTPMLTLAALLPAALIGATIGYASVDLARHNPQALRWVGGGGVLLIVLIPVGIVSLPYILSALPARPPTSEETRAEWARWLSQTPGPIGAELAARLQACLGESGMPPSGEALIGNGCDDVRRRWLGLGPDRLQKLGAYTHQDDGWRWDFVDSAGARRLTVFPDSLLRQAGPTFEVRRGQTVRHEARPAPGERPDSTLPRLAAWRQCLHDRALELRGTSPWSALFDSLPGMLLNEGPSGNPCPGAWVDDRPDHPRLPWILSWRNGDSYPLRVVYRPIASDSAEVPFEVLLLYRGMGYTLDTDGRWHARKGGYAMPVDPPPAACLTDPAVACE